MHKTQALPRASPIYSHYFRHSLDVTLCNLGLHDVHVQLKKPQVRKQPI